MARTERNNQVKTPVPPRRLTPTRGRPKLYDADYIPRAANVLCKDHGFTLKQLARVFGVALVTVKTWMQKHDDFNHAVKSGREHFDTV